MRNPSNYREGDVLRYEPGGDSAWRSHCREGLAVVSLHPTMGKRALDTFWGTGGDQHLLTESELATSELLFNIHDYDELDRYGRQSEKTWKTYAPADREVITSQHGLQKRWFIRKGAQPDWSTQIANAEEEVRAKESALRSVQWALDRAREDLEKLKAAAGVDGV